MNEQVFENLTSGEMLSTASTFPQGSKGFNPSDMVEGCVFKTCCKKYKKGKRCKKCPKR
jgi:hypothetical protein